MNQTRTFLLIAWLMVATLLWMEWGKERSRPDVPALPAATQVEGGASAVPAAQSPGAAAIPNAPAAPAAATTPGATPAAASLATPSVALVTVTSDVLRLELDGGTISKADLLRFPKTRDANAPAVRLFDTDPQTFYVAQSGWVSGKQAAPTHERGFVPAGDTTTYALAQGQDTLQVPFVWRGPDGVTIDRVLTFRRGSYAIDVQDTVRNTGGAAWEGFVYRQITRAPPTARRSMTNADTISFLGGTWFTANEGFDRRKFADFASDGPLNLQATGLWIAMLQHHFFSAWIPQPADQATISLHVDNSSGVAHDLIREVGPGVSVPPGGEATTTARLWVGPKLVEQIKAQDVRGLDRAVDYSRFGWLAWLASGLFWLLEKIHGLIGNWGWSIIGLVLIVKIAMYPLSNAQYKSMAKMRKFQPRIAQLKERYGEDRQKFQTAMMELYKKEKINPVGGCLPLLVQMPVFFALYCVLLESVELRQAPWAFWIHDLTARDPYFILPIINIAVMWATQKLTPMTGMDPMQQKMMQFMPLVFGAFMIFFPSGLVLYWVTNGSLGLLQQWWLIRLHADKPDAKPSKS